MPTMYRRRLEFDDELLDELGRSRRRRKGPPPPMAPWAWRVAAGIVAGVLVGWVGSPLISRSGDTRGLKDTTAALITCLASNNLDRALSLWAEDNNGTAGPVAEDTRTAAAATPQEQRPSSEATRRSRLELLETVRSDLQKAGVRWDTARPLAFGGVRARVHDTAAKPTQETRIVGNLYFTSQGKLFAIELSGYEANGAFSLAELWQWSRLDIDPEDIEEHWRRCCQAFEREPASQGDSARISRVRRVLVRFQNP